MRSIARQSTRLADSERLIHQARVRSSKQAVKRDFHGGAIRPSGAFSPNGGRPGHVLPLEQSFGTQESNEVGQQLSAAEQDECEHKEDVRKPGNWKSFRQRRMALEAPPAPPPIPEWFTKYNVKICLDTVKLGCSGGQEKALKLVDQQTGHTLFTVPYRGGQPKLPNSSIALDVLSWMLPEAETQREDRVPPEQAKNELQEKLKAVENTRQNNLEQGVKEREGRLEDASDRDQKATDQLATQDMEGNSGKVHIEQFESIGQAEPSLGMKSSLAQSRELDRSRLYLLMLHWVVLDIELAVRAGMIAATDSRQASSHAASKVDLSLLCPDPKSHSRMDDVVEFLSTSIGADIIRLDANDFADLTAEFVGHDLDSPGSLAALAYDVFDGYSAIKPNNEPLNADENEVDELDEDEDDASGSSSHLSGALRRLYDRLYEKRHELEKALDGVVVDVSVDPDVKSASQSSSRSRRSAGGSSSLALAKWDEGRLDSLLDSLLDAPKLKRTQSAIGHDSRTSLYLGRSFTRDSKRSTDNVHEEVKATHAWHNAVTDSLVMLFRNQSGEPQRRETQLTLEDQSHFTEVTGLDSTTKSAPRIVHVRDLRDISQHRTGRTILRRLIGVVRKRRQAGENILIVGTSSFDPLSNSDYSSIDWNNTFPALEQVQTSIDVPICNYVVPPFFSISKSLDVETKAMRTTSPPEFNMKPMYRRIMEINLRHIQSMLRRLRPGESVELFTDAAQRQLGMAGPFALSQDVFSQDRIHRIVLTAIGLSKSYAKSDVVQPVHIGLAIHIMKRSLDATDTWIATMKEKLKPRSSGNSAKLGTTSSSSDKADARVEQLKAHCNPHETKLLSGVVDPSKIKIGFKQVHAPAETIEALTTLTSLSLTRPEAFKYGILAQDRLTGVMLYGPPGTGKTLLAKAVAKECEATVLEVNGAQIYEKYVGEGEKMVRAVFSLARKLSPCIVFIDEADALFGQRRGDARNTHREIINQFLREWDGMDSHDILLMVASNRPFDVDDAVLRRLPRRLLVDLPTAQDRESILKIHLHDELLDDSVSFAELAKETPFYSGSDLKNLCVAAALACVREESEMQAQNRDNPTFRLPDKRVVGSHHFQKALKEVSASIGEDMSSLKAIKKFDEQYGDGRGKRKRAGYGFGAGDAALDESAARVRPPPRA